MAKTYIKKIYATIITLIDHWYLLCQKILNIIV